MKIKKYQNPDSTLNWWNQYKSKKVGDKTLYRFTDPKTGQVKWVDPEDSGNFEGRRGYAYYDDEGNPTGRYTMIEGDPQNAPIYQKDVQSQHLIDRYNADKLAEARTGGLEDFVTPWGMIGKTINTGMGALMENLPESVQKAASYGRYLSPSYYLDPTGEKGLLGTGTGTMFDFLTYPGVIKGLKQTPSLAARQSFSPALQNWGRGRVFSRMIDESVSDVMGNTSRSPYLSFLSQPYRSSQGENIFQQIYNTRMQGAPPRFHSFNGKYVRPQLRSTNGPSATMENPSWPRMNLSQLEQALQQRGIDSSWMDYGRQRWSGRFNKIGDSEITAPQQNFDDLFYQINNRLESLGESTIDQSSLTRVPQPTRRATPQVTTDPVTDLVRGASGNQILASRVINALHLKDERGNPLSVEEVNRRFRRNPDLFDHSYLSFNEQHPQQSYFRRFSPTATEQQIRRLNDYYNTDKYIKTRLSSQTPYTLNEIMNMFDDVNAGEFKQNVALDYFYPGSHGIANWNRGTLNDKIRGYIRTITNSPVTMFDSPSGGYFKSGVHPGGRVFTHSQDMRNLLADNPKGRSGVIIPDIYTMEGQLSTNSADMTIKHLGRELNNGRNIMGFGEKTTQGPALNTLGQINAYDWKVPFEEKAINFFKQNPHEIDNITTSVGEDGLINVEYNGRVLARGTKRGVEELAEILNEQTVKPFNEAYGHKFELKPFTFSDSRNTLYAPANLFNKILFKSGGKLNKKCLIKKR